MVSQFRFAVIDQHGALLQQATVQSANCVQNQHQAVAFETLARAFRESTGPFTLPIVLGNDQPGSLAVEWRSPSGSGGSANFIWREKMCAHALLLTGQLPKVEQVYLRASADAMEHFAGGQMHPFDRTGILSITERPAAIVMLTQNVTVGLSAMLGLATMITFSALMETSTL